MNEVYAIKNKRDIDAIRAQLSGRDLLLFELGVNCGLRISDMVKLTVGDVRGRKVFRIREEKTDKAREVTINDKLAKVIAKCVPGDVDAAEPLFKSRKGGKAITRQHAYKIINDAADRAGVLDRVGAIGCHSLRKTFGYHVYNADPARNLSLLMRIFNHSSERVTLRYIGIERETVANVYESLNI